MVRDAKLETRAARLRLPVGPEPHWRGIGKGLHLGYRRLATGGSWTARRRTAAGRYRETSLGIADDHTDADGLKVLDYGQAQAKAQAWHTREGRLEAGLDPDTGEPPRKPQDGPQTYTVAQAMADYLAWFRRHRKAVGRVEHVVNAWIVPALGDEPCEALTAERLRAFHERVADSPPRARTAKGKTQQHRAFDPTDTDARRARQASANRVWTVLRAALNHAYRDGKIGSDQAWRRVRPFRAVGASRIRYLSDDEARRLVNACEPDFRRLVQAALLTGARLGELAALTAADYRTGPGVVLIRVSKSGKARHVVLADEGRAFFDQVSAGLAGEARLFTTADGATWDQANHHRPLGLACRAAKIDPPITFHGLRHTYASRLAMRAVPLQVIADQLGHADTRMTMQHYAHLAPSYVADVIRGAAGSIGIVELSAVAMLRQKRAPSG